MRKTSWRLVIAMMQTVGTVSGVVGALGVVMALFGFVGRRTA